MKNNLRKLIKQKEIDSNREITHIEIEAETGVSRFTIWRMLKYPNRGISSNTIDRLCRYFECEVGDLLEKEETSV